jgi:hypothetical protein
LLVGTGVPFNFGGGLMSVYDISDCAHPRLLNPGPGADLQLPLPITAHEGGFSPDGRTYWSSGTAGVLSAVDFADPATPRVIWQGWIGLSGPGFGISPGGNRLYLSNNFGGLTVLDTGAVQRRDANPQVPQLAKMAWTDGRATQHSIPVTYAGHPFLFTVGEAGSGGVKLIDVADDANLQIVNSIKLEIDLPENIDSQIASGMGGIGVRVRVALLRRGPCRGPDRPRLRMDVLGVRVFDVGDPFDVRELGYFNPPAMTDRNPERPNSSHAWASLLGVPALITPARCRPRSAGSSIRPRRSRPAAAWSSAGTCPPTGRTWPPTTSRRCR